MCLVAMNCNQSEFTLFGRQTVLYIAFESFIRIERSRPYAK